MLFNQVRSLTLVENCDNVQLSINFPKAVKKAYLVTLLAKTKHVTKNLQYERTSMEVNRYILQSSSVTVCLIWQ